MDVLSVDELIAYSEVVTAHVVNEVLVQMDAWSILCGRSRLKLFLRDYISTSPEQCISATLRHDVRDPAVPP